MAVKILLKEANGMAFAPNTRFQMCKLIELVASGNLSVGMIGAISTHLFLNSREVI
jgi:hypothetical protein